MFLYIMSCSSDEEYDSDPPNMNEIFLGCSKGPQCMIFKNYKYDTYYYVHRLDDSGEHEIAPNPNGKCYCGRVREECLNFIAYQRDCNGFTQYMAEDAYEVEHPYDNKFYTFGEST